MKKILIFGLCALLSAHLHAASEETSVSVEEHSIPGGTTELQPLAQGGPSKEAILKQIKKAEDLMDLSTSTAEEMKSHFTSSTTYNIFKAHVAVHNRKTRLLDLAAHARAENWGQGYVDAIDELLAEDQKCLFQ